MEAVANHLQATQPLFTNRQENKAPHQIGVLQERSVPLVCRAWE